MKNHKDVQHAIDTYRAIDAYAKSTVPEFVGPPEPGAEWLDASNHEEMVINSRSETKIFIDMSANMEDYRRTVK